MEPIYLDHNATTPVAPEVRAAMLPYLGELFGNPSSGYRAGREARAAVERARAQVAALVGGRPEEIVFTSGGTEANNLALIGFMRAHGTARRHAVASAIEHPAVLEPLRALRGEGVEVTLVPPGPHGSVDPEEVLAAVRPATVARMPAPWVHAWVRVTSGSPIPARYMHGEVGAGRDREHPCHGSEGVRRAHGGSMVPVASRPPHRGGDRDPADRRFSMVVR